MYNYFMSLFAPFVLLTLFLDTNRAHSLDVNHEDGVNITGPKQSRPLPIDKEESMSKFWGTKDSAKEPFHLDNSGDGTNFKPRIESIASTPSVRGNYYYGFISSRYPNMPIYLKRLLQRTHAKLEKKRVMLSNMSQRMEMKMKRIFSNQFPFNGGVYDDYVNKHDDYMEECCDHEEYMERFEDEMDAFQDYVEDYNDYLEDYIDSLNFSSPNGSQANKVRIDIISDYPKSPDSRIIITQSDNGSPYPSQIMSTNLRPNSVLQIQGGNAGLSQSGIVTNEQDGRRQLHAANYY